MIAFLSVFALQPEPDGTFLIKRNSLYGKVFLWWSKLEDADDFSFCRTFWQTNGMLVVTGFALGALAILGTILWVAIADFGILKILLGVAVVIAIIVTVCLLIGGIALLWNKARKRFDVFDTFSDAVTSDTSKAIATILFVLALLALLFLANGVYAVFTFLWKAALVILVVVAIIVAVVLMVKFALKVFKPLSQTQFGNLFDSFYHRYFCPRIRVE